eukprot:CAMPEP_0174335522 /NCGR_PEP_ID=MMETSP0810-20121108/20851_1 /TAXON_ID=73025 ORGANISM="Eutreptiella gymnastica-like, Strain CCMP1594" /NCGR_SAMPLE_ID=MMETSP0810 /ASSEMBLY_ACC=CAM_ASM_000659 /LENGTH=38 /DNA_ID= /DNA_START= /DNA_END= /DNA_ORIENTATION=
MIQSLRGVQQALVKKRIGPHDTVCKKTPNQGPGHQESA